ncbi:MAG TPA: hypothetical protein VMU08_02115 [Rhizomicrobium sp.]|nr:hypothetical protein [Rhizomicrobium sp.]
MSQPYTTDTTLGDFAGRYNAKWFWFICLDCACHVAAPRAPFVIRWGPGAPVSVLTGRTRCRACGGRRLTTMAAGRDKNSPDDCEHAQFPVERGWCAERFAASPVRIGGQMKKISTAP